MAKTIEGRARRDRSKNRKKSWGHQDRQPIQAAETIRDETRGPRSGHRKKDTRQWCRGKVGVEHDPRWVPSRWASAWNKGGGILTLEEASNWDWTCRECGKVLKWKWNPAKKPAWARSMEDKK